MIQKYFVFLMILIFADFSSPEFLSAQQIYEEPEVTAGLKNIVYCTPDFQKELYVVGLDDSTCLLKRGVFDSSTFEYFPPNTEPLKPLREHIAYKFYLKWDYNQEFSDTVSSTQDNTPPVYTSLPRITNKSNADWCNTLTVNFKFTVEDDAGISEVRLFRWNSDSNKWGVDTLLTDFYSPIKLRRGDTLIDTTVSFSFEAEGTYPIFLGVKDAAHAPESREDSLALGGNFHRPTSDSLPHDTVRIDITKPISKLNSLEDHFITLDSVEFAFSANDPKSNSIESGLDFVELYYDYKPTNLDADFTIKNKLYDQKLITENNYDEYQGVFTFNPQSAEKEGIYELYTLAIDSARNRQSDTTFIHLVVDVTPPVVTEAFNLSDPTTSPTQFETKAEPGWTNEMTVNATVKAEDPVAGLDSMHFSGDVSYDANSFDTVFAESLPLTLANGEDKNSVNLVISDSAGNDTPEMNFTITHDSTPPVLDNLRLEAMDGDLKKTILRKINVFPTLLSTESDHLWGYALFENLPENYQEREALFKPGIDLPLEYEFPEDATYDQKRVYCVVRDSAGNVSDTVSATIELVEPLTITSFVMKDLNLLPEDRRTKWTNSHSVEAKLTLSRPPGDNAFFEFDTTELFTNPFDTLFIAEMDSENLTFSSLLTFRDYWQDGEKVIYVRLKEPKLGDTSAVISDTIILDTTPPMFDGQGLVLRDSIKISVDTGPDIEALPGWTNDSAIQALVSCLSDTDSGLDILIFKGNLEGDSLVIPFTENQKLQLNQQQFESDDTCHFSITVYAQDSAGNRGNLSIPNSFSKANIIYEKVPHYPKFEFNWEGSRKLTEDDSVPINVIVKDRPSNSAYLSIAYLWEKDHYPDSVQSFLLEPDANGKQILFYKIFEDQDSVVLSGIATDNAGNCSNVDTVSFFIREKPTISISLFDYSDIQDGSFVGKCRKVGVKFDIKENIQIDSVKLSENKFAANLIHGWIKFPEDSVIYYPLTGPDGIKKLWARGKRILPPAISDITSASICLDTTKPTLDRIQLNNGAKETYKTTIGILLEGAEDSPNCGSIRDVVIATDAAFKSNCDKMTWKGDADQPYEFTLPRKTGTKTIYVQLVDNAENESDPVSEEIALELNPDKCYNVPNPFNPLDSDPKKGETVIVCNTKDANNRVTVTIYDVFGHLVADLKEPESSTGRQKLFRWKGRNEINEINKFVTDGVYIAVIKEEGQENQYVKIAVSKK